MVSAIYQHESAMGMYGGRMSPPLKPPSHLPPHPTSRLSQTTGFGFPESYSKFPLAIYFTNGNVYISMLLSQIIPLFSLPHHVQKPVPYVCTSTAALYIGSSGEGNGNPLQHSCLENPRDRGAWWAAIYGVAQSRTRLK